MTSRSEVDQGALQEPGLYQLNPFHSSVAARAEGSRQYVPPCFYGGPFSAAFAPEVHHLPRAYFARASLSGIREQIVKGGVPGILFCRVSLLRFVRRLLLR